MRLRDARFHPKIWVCLALALLTALTLAACAASRDTPLPERPFIIAVDQHFPPFIQMENGQPAGLGIALLQAAARRVDLDLVFLPQPFAQVQQALESGQADGIFPLTPNAQRLERLDFSDALISTGGALFVRAPSATPASLHALHGKSIMTPQTGPLADYIRRTTPNIGLITTTDYDDTLRRLMAGEASAAALNLQVGRQLVNARYAGQITLPERYFWEVSLAVAVRKNPAEKASAAQTNLQRLNTGIRAIRADGTWRALIDTYQVFVPQPDRTP